MNEIEKEIEEMARVMAECEKTCDECFAEYEKLFTQPIQNGSKHCQSIRFAQWLYNAGYRQVKETIKKIIDFIESLKVPEDGRHEWRDHHNDCIDKVILKINQKFINGVEVEKDNETN